MAQTGIDQLIAQAVSGDGQACFDLYQEYKSGLHVQEDEAAAMSWLEKAIDCNHPVAQLIMGLSLLSAKRLDEAVDYLQLACANGNADAMNVLGQLYLGNVEKVSEHVINQDKGIELLTKAGLAGNINAQVMLGKCCYTGKWVSKNKFFAKIWLEMAAAQGSEDALQLYDEACRVPSLPN